MKHHGGACHGRWPSFLEGCPVCCEWLGKWVADQARRHLGACTQQTRLHSSLSLGEMVLEERTHRVTGGCLTPAGSGLNSEINSKPLPKPAHPLYPHPTDYLLLHPGTHVTPPRHASMSHPLLDSMWVALGSRWCLAYRLTAAGTSCMCGWL